MKRGRPARRREQVLAYVRTVIADEGSPPSYGMICQALGINSRQEVCRIIGHLESAGSLVRVGRGRVRRLRLGANT